MKSITFRLFLLTLCCFNATSFAQTIDLYAGEAVVADESPGARSAALTRVLGDVMVRVSGRSDVLVISGAKKVLAEASSLVQQFRYRTAPATREGEPESVPEKYLRARFDPVALKRAMTQQGLPVWIGDRPRVLLWVAVEQGANRRLLDIASDTGLWDNLQQRAAVRGVPLQLPLLDLQDRSVITAADIWSGYATAIREASARYPHDVILSGSLRRQADGYWSGRWMLWRGEYRQEFTSGGGQIGPALAAGIDAAQDHLAESTGAPHAGAGNLVRIRIQGVSVLADYARLMRLLGDNPVVQGIVLLQANRGGILLGMQVAGGVEGAARILDNVSGLTQVATSPVENAVPEAQGLEGSAATPADLTAQFQASATAE